MSESGDDRTELEPGEIMLVARWLVPLVAVFFGIVLLIYYEA